MEKLMQLAAKKAAKRVRKKAAKRKAPLADESAFKAVKIEGPFGGCGITEGRPGDPANDAALAAELRAAAEGYRATMGSLIAAFDRYEAARKAAEKAGLGFHTSYDGHTDWGQFSQVTIRNIHRPL